MRATHEAKIHTPGFLLGGVILMVYGHHIDSAQLVFCGAVNTIVGLLFLLAAAVLDWRLE